jgi:glycosyltransferase involved in cell wall biosynthesis
METGSSPAKLISVVIPVFNEAPSLEELAGELRAVATAHKLTLEVIIVDDGSQDHSWGIIQRLAAADPRVRGIRFRRNFGKASALAAGFEAATGDVVFQMDADLQDDPAEIPHFLATLEGGFDVVNGWKRKRLDSWHRVLASRVFNWLVSRLTGLRLHDHNCGLKCFRAEVVKHLPLYGEMHRFITVFAHFHGFRVTEAEVQHRRRRYGHSKYGPSRFVKGFLDLITVTFLVGFGQRPLHLLGGVGLLASLLGSLGLAYLAICWCLARLDVPGYGPIGHRPLLTYSVAALIAGFQMIATGFLAELIVARSATSERVYDIAEVTKAREPVDL